MRCKKLLEEKRITELEHLVSITKDVFDIDRNMMFWYLLKAYSEFTFYFFILITVIRSCFLKTFTFSISSFLEILDFVTIADVDLSSDK